MRVFLFILFFCFGRIASAQPELTEVKGLPTDEAFDLLVDKKGYLWVGHDMGLSRFDGVAFTHFSHPKRSSLSITDLVEDRFGRVWCHNFTGQVFYIENGRMHLLEAYRNEAEDFFPRMALCGDEIIVTSSRGLFVCDTKTLTSRYLKAGKNCPTKTLAVLGNKVLALNVNEWYLYDAVNGFRATSLVEPKALVAENRNLVLQPNSFRDTAYVLANPSGMVYKVNLAGERVALSEKMEVGHFVNAVHSLKNQLWVHGRERSSGWYGAQNVRVLEGINISDMAADRQGNLWISSLNKGLLLEVNSEHVREVSFPFLETGDMIMAMRPVGNNLLVGTKNGMLYEVLPHSRTEARSFNLPHDIGSINAIFPERDGKVLLSTSSGTFLLNRVTGKAYLHYAGTSKGVVIEGDRVLAATATGFLSYPFVDVEGKKLIKHELSLDQWNDWWNYYKPGAGRADTNHYYWFSKRSRAIALPQGQDLYVSFMDGVYQLGKNGPQPLVVDGAKVYSNTMLAHKDRLYIGTLNSGLLIKGSNGYKQISTAEGLFSNSIVKMKMTGQYLWIFQDRGIQLMDLQTESLINGFELPQETGANVHDVAAFGDTATLSTNNGTYQVVLKPSTAYKNIRSYLQAMLTDRPDQPLHSGITFKHNENDIQFQLSIPFYSPSNTVYFKYRLIGGGADEQWFTTNSGERIVRFASLMPGNYTFQAFAVVAGSQEEQPLSFSFSIDKPWWQTNLFLFSLGCFVVLIFYGIYRYRVRQIVKLEQVRRTISSDLHDEIGSTLSSINIYSELARNEADNKEFLNLIQENTSDVIGKLDDLVWSINPKNDSVAQLVSRMRSFSGPVLSGVGINCRFEANEELLQQELSLVTKRNIYLVFKELVNNVVKHSKAKNCTIEIQFANGKISMVVCDDGIGIDKEKMDKGRSGMQSMLNRARQLKATLYFLENAGGGTCIRLSVPVK